MNQKKNLLIKKYYKVILIVFIVSSILVALVFVINLSTFITNKGEQVVYSNDMYTLKGQPTQLQKDLFKELTSELNLNIQYDMTTVELVVRNFVADYYTWSNKQGPYDVGGRNFVYGNENLNFYRTSRRYFYSAISTYLNKGLAMTDLPEVETVTTRPASFAANYNYYGDDLLAFYCEVEWTYKTNDKVDLSVFPTSAAFTLTQTEDGRYEIVRFY